MQLRDAGVAVFCSSSSKAPESYLALARETGTRIAEAGAILVYGGATLGLMGACADAALAAGGRVVGVIPQNLVNREIAHPSLSELHVVTTMHERKALMSDRSSAYVVLPGGFGTFEEAFEVITWRMLGIHTKPVVLVNAQGYYDPLLELVDRGLHDGLIRPEYRGLMSVVDSAAGVMATLEAYDLPATTTGKWF